VSFDSSIAVPAWAVPTVSVRASAACPTAWANPPTGVYFMSWDV
jgi:hypothetical protein